MVTTKPSLMIYLESHFEYSFHTSASRFPLVSWLKSLLKAKYPSMIKWIGPDIANQTIQRRSEGFSLAPALPDSSHVKAINGAAKNKKNRVRIVSLDLDWGT